MWKSGHWVNKSFAQGLTANWRQRRIQTKASRLLHILTFPIVLFCLIVVSRGVSGLRWRFWGRSFWLQCSEWTGSGGVRVLIAGRAWSQAGHLQGCHRGPQVAALGSETKCLRPEALLLWDMHEDHVRPLSYYLMMIPTHKQIALNHSLKSCPRSVSSPLSPTLGF